MIVTYKDRESGKSVELEVTEMDTNFAIFKEKGRMPETLARADFDKRYELALPAVNPATIPIVSVTQPKGSNPLGLPVAASVIQDDPVGKMLRAIGQQLHDLETEVMTMAARVEVIWKVIAPHPTEKAEPHAPEPHAEKKSHK